jgi:glycosyltransferase involved in cell wall biosynthesis
MLTPWHICILIPAKDEEVLLERCLQSILLAAANLPKHYTFDIVLAIDSSTTDQTFSIAKKILHTFGTLMYVPQSNVGLARRQATHKALQRYQGLLQHCWLANTDADSEIPLNWLTHQIALANQGIQAIAGIVSVDSFAEHEAHVENAFKETYLINADGTHPHVHGANLGLRADVYVKVGGWSALKTAEDHDLWKRLRAANTVMHSDATLSIKTSGRRVGRAPDGFANALSLHNRGSRE